MLHIIVACQFKIVFIFYFLRSWKCNSNRVHTPIMDILTHSDPRGKGQWYMYMDIILYHNTHEDLKFNTSQTPYATYSWSRLLENSLNLSDIRSDRKIFHIRPGNFLSDKFLFCVEHLTFFISDIRTDKILISVGHMTFLSVKLTKLALFRNTVDPYTFSQMLKVEISDRLGFKPTFFLLNIPRLLKFTVATRLTFWTTDKHRDIYICMYKII